MLLELHTMLIECNIDPRYTTVSLNKSGLFIAIISLFTHVLNLDKLLSYLYTLQSELNVAVLDRFYKIPYMHFTHTNSL